MASWWDKISNEEPPPAAASNAPSSDARGKWWPQVSGGQTIGPAAPLPSNVSEDPSAMASAGNQAIGSLPTDEMARVQYLASKRFPDLSPNKALENYFYKDNRLAYKTADGKAFYEEPVFRLPTSLPNISQDMKALSTGIGPSLPMIGGTIGGLFSLTEGPGALFTGVPQATAGAVAADVVRQGLASWLTNEEKPLSSRIMQSAKEGVTQGVGQIFGNSIGRGLNFLGNTPTYNIPETSVLRDLSEKTGISLTPGEETGNRTLLRRQKILGNSTEGEAQFTNFYEGRNEQVRSAVNNLLNRLSPQASPRMGAAEGVEGAKGALKVSQQELSKLVKPAYESAIDNNPQRFWSQEAEDLFIRPSMQKAIGAAKNLAAEEGRTLTVPTFENGKRVVDDIVPDWRSWDYIKKALDGIIEENTNDAGRLTQYGRSVVQTREKLLGILDTANTGYPEARGIFKSGVPARAALEKGVVGDAARLEGNDVLRAGRIIFGAGSSPEDVTLAREAFQKAGKIDAWDSLARSHLQQIFEGISDSSTGAITNIGGTFRKAILGTDNKRKIIDAAFAHRPEFAADVLDLAKVLDATGRAMKGESITAFAQAGQKELEREGGGIAPKLLETIEVWKTPSRIARYWSDLNTSRYAAKQAELFTTPEGREVLRELKRLGPTSAGSVITLSQFLTGGAISSIGKFVEPSKNGPVLDRLSNGGGPR